MSFQWFSREEIVHCSLLKSYNSAVWQTFYCSFKLHRRLIYLISLVSHQVMMTCEIQYYVCFWRKLYHLSTNTPKYTVLIKCHYICGLERTHSTCCCRAEKQEHRRSVFDMTFPLILCGMMTYSYIKLSKVLVLYESATSCARGYLLTFVSSCVRATQIKTYSWDNAQVILAGNKCDMEEERIMSVDSGRLLAEQLGE